MPLKQMSYNSAEKIIDILSAILMNSNLKVHEMHSYSLMQGYDIVDVSNASKLLIAYEFFNDGNENKSKLKIIEAQISSAEGALSGFSLYFVPDGIAHALRQIDSSDPVAAFLEASNLTKDKGNYEWEKMIESHEIPSSFYRFCQSIGNKDPDFWEKIYSRIGITWESNNWKDRIYFLIENKNIYNDIRNDNESIDVPDLDNKNENKSTSLFKQLKNKLFRFLK